MRESVKIVLLNSKKEILLHLRDNKRGIPSPNLWGLIGGAVEKNETVLEALKRETKEEIGVEAEDIRFLKKIFVREETPIKCDWANHMFVGKININEKDIKLTEGQEVKFFNIDQILKMKELVVWSDFIIDNRDKILT